MVTSSRTIMVTGLVTCLILSAYLVSYNTKILHSFFVDNSPPPSQVLTSLRTFNKLRNATYSQVAFRFPRIVHHTWKTGSSPPAETTRWRKGCMQLNPDYEFKMYDDDDLLHFAEKYYPRYLSMLKHLKGVYMADMARVLVTYHYGGLYVDLDFYCHRPYACLERYVVQRALPMLMAVEESKQERQMRALADSGAVLKDRGASNITYSRADSEHNPAEPGTRTSDVRDVLVVSREPQVHAVLFRNKSRVVIQDFFLATPRHPFLHWLLEDRLALFQRAQQGQQGQLEQHVSEAAFPKGPFSYSIEKDIDAYYATLDRIEAAAKAATTAAATSKQGAGPNTHSAAVSVSIASEAIEPPAPAVQEPPVLVLSAQEPPAGGVEVATISTGAPYRAAATDASLLNSSSSASLLNSSSSASLDGHRRAQADNQKALPLDGVSRPTPAAAGPAAADPAAADPAAAAGPAAAGPAGATGPAGPAGAVVPVRGMIVELPELVLHPMVDSTNSRLFSTCAGVIPDAPTDAPADAPHPAPPARWHRRHARGIKSHTAAAASGEPVEGQWQWEAARAEACGVVHRGEFFRPGADTILVHMWTHVYLGWSIVRGLYNTLTYFRVESTLPATFQCHDVSL